MGDGAGKNLIEKLCDADARADAAILHLRNVLHAISDMDSGDMCAAIQSALDFYNAEQPNDRVVFSNI